MISIEQAPGGAECVARITGDLDMVTVPELRAALDEVVRDGCRTIVCDLSKTTYMDSSALGFLVWADRVLEPVSGRLMLAGANADVSRIIELSGLIGAVPSVSATESVEKAFLSLRMAEETAEPLLVESFAFPADPQHLGVVRGRVAEIVAPFGLTESAQFDFKVAVGEALANAVRHGSPQGMSNSVDVEVRAYADRIVVSVSDAGCGFNGEATRAADVYAAGGRGVLFMRALADFVEFRRSAGGGTCVRLAKVRTDQPTTAV